MFVKVQAFHHCLHHILPADTQHNQTLRKRGHNFIWSQRDLIYSDITFVQLRVYVFFV